MTAHIEKIATNYGNELVLIAMIRGIGMTEFSGQLRGFHLDSNR
ncbi:hypothetical protein [Listeria cornellensis]|nr:hypothetical protein [Listeria cornellensis]